MGSRKTVVIDAVRTPVGRYGGALSKVRPDDLAALVIRALIDRTHIDLALIDDVYLGAANQAGEDNRNVARMAVLLAGLPDSVPGSTVNRLCASSLDAINIAARMIEAGHGDVMIAGGVESMTRAPFAMAKAAEAFSRTPEVYDTTIGWRFTNPKLAAIHHPYSMGETAENVARKYKLSREEQDRFAYESQIKCKAAMEAGRFKDEIVPVMIEQKGKDVLVVDRDEHPRPDTTMEALAKLKPAFANDGTVTAGNSSGINDGAAALLLVEESLANKLGLTPLAVVGASATAGVDPSCMGLGPIPAVRRALARAKLTIRAIDLIELNEAFAAQSIPCIRELEMDPSRVNVNGGAIALGHPLGCSGARISTTLLHEMKRRGAKRGLATMCVGVGQGVATLFEPI
ncbi:MAG: acetyl-CoA C-acyltransferase [Planctomycetes bacterium]|nr:acetyl-CoA C-acyltransferase [Planctomycetota bacterium]MBI3835943.1 acetyl-CoA C-acyltransferase [Planctomycetota bacterium]